MPIKPKHECNQNGCTILIPSGQPYCEKHKKEIKKYHDERYDKKRGTATERGYDRRWQKVRKMYLSRHPFCEQCSKDSIITTAYLVHHIDGSKDNFMSLCKNCHNRIHLSKK